VTLADPHYPAARAAGGELTPADLFNGFVGASVVYALNEIGLFDKLAGEAPTRADALAAELDVAPARLAALVRAASALGYVEEGVDGLTLTEAGECLMPLRGYFTWLVGGYGELLRELPGLADGSRRFGADVDRDEARVAEGAGANDRAFMAPLLADALDRLSFTSFADVGCGAGGRLIDVCRRYPGVAGVGIDVSPDACALARANVARAGLGDRITILCADIETVRADDDLASIDLVGSFFMLHDLMQERAAGSDVFERLGRAFPNARYYVLADTMRMTTFAGTQPPIFSLGYELVHAFMGVELFPRSEYEELFRRSGLEVERRAAFGTPNSWLYVLARTT
jgi:SAM-dependent methyltransferase